MDTFIGNAGEKLVTETIAFWQGHYGVEVTPDDAREMVENLTGFFRLLAEWDSAEKDSTGIYKTETKQ